MIITRTPLRISFLGGGTDYPEYFKKYGGQTLVTTINKYVTITIHRLTEFLDCSIRIHYSRLESVNCVDEIQHPSARECLRFLGINGGIEIHYIDDLPARTGLGSSSSATVGLLNALHAFKGEMVSVQRLAEEAVYVEQNLIRERVGCQDQYACAVGGLLHLRFEGEGQVQVSPVAMTRERVQALEERLMLFYTGLQRRAHEVLDEQLVRTKSGENDSVLEKMRQIVTRGVEVLSARDHLYEFGELLHESWELKRQLSSKVSVGWIDKIYDEARKAGAVGGKLLGAGGGGFLLFYVEPYNRERVRESVSELKEVKFEFDDSGSTIIFYRP